MHAHTSISKRVCERRPNCMFLIPRDNEIVNSDYAYTSIRPMCVCVHIVNFYLASMLICMVYCVGVSLYMHAQREL